MNLLFYQVYSPHSSNMIKKNTYFLAQILLLRFSFRHLQHQNIAI